MAPAHARRLAGCKTQQGGLAGRVRPKTLFAQRCALAHASSEAQPRRGSVCKQAAHALHGARSEVASGHAAMQNAPSCKTIGLLACSGMHGLPMRLTAQWALSMLCMGHSKASSPCIGFAHASKCTETPLEGHTHQWCKIAYTQRMPAPHAGSRDASHLRPCKNANHTHASNTPRRGSRDPLRRHRWALFATCKTAARLVIEESDRRTYNPCVNYKDQRRRRSLDEVAETVSRIMALSPNETLTWGFNNANCMYDGARTRFMPVCLPERVSHLTTSYCAWRDIPWSRLVMLNHLKMSDVGYNGWGAACFDFESANLPRLHTLCLVAVRWERGEEEWTSDLENCMSEFAAMFGDRITTVILEEAPSEGPCNELKFAWITKMKWLAELHLSGIKKYNENALRDKPSLRLIQSA